MMVYGLNPERVNCDRLFNLFCLYGNVVRVSKSIAIIGSIPLFTIDLRFFTQ